jgi:hypothetical protein
MDKETLNRIAQKFFADPDFHWVLEMLSKKTESLRNVATIDLKDSAETIKAQIAGRQETIKLVDEFINDVQVATSTSNNKPTTFK